MKNSRTANRPTRRLASQAKFLIVRLALEGVIPIGMAAAEPEPGGAAEVGRDEQQAPPLVLGYVDQLVLAGAIQIACRASQDGVPQRQGARAPRDRRSRQEPRQPAAVEFKHSPHALRTAPSGQADDPNHQPQQGPGKRPDHRERQ